MVFYFDNGDNSLVGNNFNSVWPFEQNLKVLRAGSEGIAENLNIIPDELYGHSRDFVQSPFKGFVGTLESCWNGNLNDQFICSQAGIKFSAYWVDEW